MRRSRSPEGSEQQAIVAAILEELDEQTTSEGPSDDEDQESDVCPNCGSIYAIADGCRCPELTDLSDVGGVA